MCFTEPSHSSRHGKRYYKEEREVVIAPRPVKHSHHHTSSHRNSYNGAPARTSYTQVTRTVARPASSTRVVAYVPSPRQSTSSYRRSGPVIVEQQRRSTQYIRWWEGRSLVGWSVTIDFQGSVLVVRDTGWVWWLTLYGFKGLWWVMIDESFSMLFNYYFRICSHQLLDDHILIIAYVKKLWKQHSSTNFWETAWDKLSRNLPYTNSLVIPKHLHHFRYLVAILRMAFTQNVWPLIA
jgi:hypothetical protein